MKQKIRKFVKYFTLLRVDVLSQLPCPYMKNEIEIVVYITTHKLTYSQYITPRSCETKRKKFKQTIKQKSKRITIY